MHSINACGGAVTGGGRSRATVTITTLAITAAVAGILGTPQSELLNQAVDWANRGNVAPYPLLSLPAAGMERIKFGEVYTRLVRLALLAQSFRNSSSAYVERPQPS